MNTKLSESYRIKDKLKKKKIRDRIQTATAKECPLLGKNCGCWIWGLLFKLGSLETERFPRHALGTSRGQQLE